MKVIQINLYNGQIDYVLAESIQDALGAYKKEYPANYNEISSVSILVYYIIIPF